MIRYLCCVASICVICAGAPAHPTTPLWFDACHVTEGIYIAVRHPSVMRHAGDVDLRVTISPLQSREPIVVEEVRWRGPDGALLAASADRAWLPALRETFDEYTAIDHWLKSLDAPPPAEELDPILDRRLELVRFVADNAIVRTHSIEDVLPATGATMTYTIEVDVSRRGALKTYTRTAEIRGGAPLPRGAAQTKRVVWDPISGGMTDGGQIMMATDGFWATGDQHLHTRYSMDAFVLDGTTENVTDYATTAQAAGLDWIIITDHSNINSSWNGEDFYTPEQFAAGSAQAQAYRDTFGWLVLYGQEMGLGSQGFWNLPSHMLAYPRETDSTGYIANPSSGLVFGHANCEPEQVIIDRIASQGGIGFIAHPFESGTLTYETWNFGNGATGWAGLELWSDPDGTLGSSDEQSWNQWHSLLGEIAAPTNGALVDRPDFPTAFPVGIGNSDAHVPGLLGNVWTYASVAGLDRPAVMDALVGGRCVASNGPLLYGAINGAGLGGVGLVHGADQVLVTLETTAEFGPIGDYTTRLYVNGVERVVVPSSGDGSFAITYDLSALDLQPTDRYVTLRTDSTNGSWHALSNPIWLQHTVQGDLDGDGAVGVGDLLLILAAWESSGPCPPDINHDGTVDVGDLLLLLSLWG